MTFTGAFRQSHRFDGDLNQGAVYDLALRRLVGGDALQLQLVPDRLARFREALQRAVERQGGDDLLRGVMACVMHAEKRQRPDVVGIGQRRLG